MDTYRTHEDAPGRLFPPRTWDNGWSMSIQADADGYACSPRERLERLEDYEAVEVVVYGPFHHPVDLSTMDLPAATLARFVPLAVSVPSIGVRLGWSDVEVLETAIASIARMPNAGIPRGCIGWSGRDVWHGTSAEDADSIDAGGIDMARSDGGYFGEGFYVADDEALARSNYADFADEEEEGVVLRFCIADGARILDLRNAVDSEIWMDSGLTQRLGRPGMAAEASRMGIQGVYDRSVGGLAIFDANALEGPYRSLDARPERISPPSP